VFFWNLSDGTTDGIRERVSFVYFVSAFCGVLNFASVLSVVVEQRAVYYRERASKTYEVEPFSFGMLFAEIPYIVITSTIFVVIMYFMVGFQSTAYGFGWFWFVFTLYSAMMTFYGQFLAILFPSVQIAQTAGAALVTIWNLFCGFLIPKSNIPDFWIWLYWLCPIRYALEAICSTQFYCEVPDCATVNYFDGTTMQSVPEWDYVTQIYGFDYSKRWYDVLAIFGFLLVFRIGGFLGLKYVKHINR